MENCGFRSIAWGGLQGRSALVQPFARLAGCAFQYCDFSGMALNGFDFSSCQFRESVFDDCKLVGASFQGAPLGATCAKRISAGPKATPSTRPPTSSKKRGSPFPKLSHFWTGRGYGLNETPNEIRNNKIGGLPDG